MKVTFKNILGTDKDETLDTVTEINVQPTGNVYFVLKNGNVFDLWDEYRTFSFEVITEVEANETD